MTRTSVVVCTRNRSNHLEQFVRSLTAQDELPAELVIVDASDTPLVREPWFAEFRSNSPFPVLHCHTAPGLTRQRNEGIDIATGDIIHFFDDDVVLSPTYLSRMNHAYQRHPEHVGGMGAIILDPHSRNPLRTALCRLFGLTHYYGDGRFYPSGSPRYPHGGLTRLTDVEVLSGCMMSFRRSVFAEDRFDTRLDGYAFLEDVEFSRRVSRKYRLFFEPAALLEHKHVLGQWPEDHSRERRRQFMFNYQYVFFTHWYPANPWYLIPHAWSVLGLFLQCANKPRSWLLGYLHGLRDSIRERVAVRRRTTRGQAPRE